MGARRKGRIIAFQSLYRHDLSGAGLEELLDFSWMDGEKTAAAADTLAFARLLIQGALENLGGSTRRSRDSWRTGTSRA